jgi:hypothetical protein
MTKSGIPAMTLLRRRTDHDVCCFAIHARSEAASVLKRRSARAGCIGKRYTTFVCMDDDASKLE